MERYADGCHGSLGYRLGGHQGDLWRGDTMRQIAVVALLGALVAGCVAMPQFEAAQAEIAALKAQVAAGTLTPEGFEVAIKRIETALPSPTEMLAVGGLGGEGRAVSKIGRAHV